MIPTLRSEAPPTVHQVFLQIGRRPVRYLILRWNWKAALFAALIRGFIYFFTSLKAGWRAGLLAMAIEASWRLPVSGFCGAITQAFRNARPKWIATVIVAVAMPVVMHCIEFLVHWSHRPPKLWLSFSVSVTVTILGALFNLFAMRRGAYVVGGEGGSFATDLRRTPAILGAFIAAGPVMLYRLVREAVLGKPAF